MKENNITILSTGPLDKEIISKSFQLDILIDVVPFIETQPVEPALLKKIIGPLAQQHALVVVSSGNAVEAMAAAMEESPQWTFYCIGKSTAEKIKKHFPASTIAATTNYAKELVEEIAESGVNQEMIFFCGDLRRDELPDQLRARGIALKEVVVYETRLTPQKLDKQYEGILFFSPSAVKSYFSLNTAGEETVLFAIGTTTAESIQSYTNNHTEIAGTPDKAALVDKAIKYFKQ
jgi:uroporphyrinogen-III synthase